ncbi:MAG: hypothetical protein HY652_03470 [Acidobacteria bacterium]|nr:hypothetical protein [Acidobacteriota bacterium]
MHRLEVGDRVHSVGGFAPSRQDLRKLKYLLYTLRPQPGLRLVVQTEGGPPRQLDVPAQVKQGKRIVDLTGATGDSDIWDLLREAQSEGRLRRHRYHELDEELIVWKMPQFDDEQVVDRMMEKARKKKALILDLRGNPGGAVSVLERLVGYLFDRDMKIADLKGRKEIKPIKSKTRGDRAFKGKLVVLVDSESGSSSEFLAHVVQLEKRGTVAGDRTAGAVMRAKYHGHELGMERVVFYGATITDADAITPDGKRLEKVGVTPDVLLLPTAADVAAQRDPVLSHAAALLGKKMEPAEAGSLFPVEW